MRQVATSLWRLPNQQKLPLLLSKKTKRSREPGTGVGTEGKGQKEESTKPALSDEDRDPPSWYSGTLQILPHYR